MDNFNSLLHKDRIIKICGMKDADNIRKVARLLPMLLGFIFYEKSPRYAGGLDPEVVRSLPDFITPVGVFVDASISEIVDTCSRYGISTIQLHGNESPEICRSLKGHGLTVFKAFGIKQRPDWTEMSSYEGTAEMFVFDTFCKCKGGSGRKFEWHMLENYPLSTPYLLSGGIGPEDVDNVLSAVRPKMAGVDINSRFESEPGVKDIDKLIHFILSLRKHNED